MSTNVTVSSGQTYYVSSGQTDTGDIVLSGGELCQTRADHFADASHNFLMTKNNY